ncbi:MAG: hypothetical protein M3Z75_33225, partial [Actinomycetota bacterium]|nr:hypothetical protein [Actinomycetota bacterium]
AATRVSSAARISARPFPAAWAGPGRVASCPCGREATRPSAAGAGAGVATSPAGGGTSRIRALADPARIAGEPETRLARWDVESGRVSFAPPEATGAPGPDDVSDTGEASGIDAGQSPGGAGQSPPEPGQSAAAGEESRDGPAAAWPEEDS